ncbi:MAG: hypothetical protein ACR2MG_02025 [Pyrinomonadaceae bacterium]
MKKKIDPTLERIRATRKRISAAYEHDIEKLVTYYLEQQRELETGKKINSKSRDRQPTLEKKVV